VRRALLDSAAALFVERGIDGVSLRDIAAEADVHLSLIRRYIGTRDQLVRAVFDDLSEQLAAEVLARPLGMLGYGTGTVTGKWVSVASALVIGGRPLVGADGFNPVLALAETLGDSYGLDPLAARLRAAQVMAAGLGWRIFEDYLVAAAELESVPVETLRDELTRSNRRLGATPWPSPPDPPARTG
jgi:TetR/AcrR family transcriptional regulator, repressor for neighboring sulfatase